MRRREEELEKLSRLARRVLGESFGHGFPHVQRVMRLAHDIAYNIGEDVDFFLLDISVLLHDIGRAIGEPHAYYSALLARSILEDRGFTREFIDKVVNAILYHSFSYARAHSIKPKTIEAMILSDADKLDALGIVGFLRVFYYGWEHGRSLEDSIKHFSDKIFRLPSLMHFEYTRRKARELVERTKRALEMLTEELGLTRSAWGSQ